MLADVYRNESKKDRLRLYYKDKVDLTEEEDQVRIRLEGISSFMGKNKCTDEDAVKYAMKKYDISQRQAQRDVKDQELLFGDVRSWSKAGLRYMMTQWAIEMYHKADIKNDFRGMHWALQNMTNINMLDKEDPDLPDPSKIQPPVQLISLTLDFVSSPYFKLLSPHIQDHVLQLKAKAEAMFQKSGIPEIMNMLMIEEAKYIPADDIDAESE
jgi:hypothetical protein